jgi:hypothetical protein
MARGHADGVPIVRHLPVSDSIKVQSRAGNPNIFSQRKTAAEMHSTGGVEQQMKTDDTRKAAVDLYWLAFLLTGSRDISIDIASDAAASDDGANPFFTGWIRGWQRRLVIAKALTAIHGDLADSARRMEIAHASRSGMPRNWALSPDTTKADLEPALLAIDLFPRATLLLLVFEGMQIADAATLLDADSDLLKKAEAIGLRELIANLAATNTDAVSAPPERKRDVRRSSRLRRGSLTPCGLPSSENKVGSHSTVAFRCECQALVLEM